MVETQRQLVLALAHHVCDGRATAPAVIWEGEGNLVESSANALVCPVDLGGVMGTGLAKAFKRRYPFCVEPYERACAENILRIGSVLVVPAPRTPRRWVVHLPTQITERQSPTLGYVSVGLMALVLAVREYTFPSLAVPALGCGRDGLIWAEVRDLTLRLLGGLTIPVKLYVPSN